jgi:hypothetical protein
MCKKWVAGKGEYTEGKQNVRISFVSVLLGSVSEFYLFDVCFPYAFPLNGIYILPFVMEILVWPVC